MRSHKLHDRLRRASETTGIGRTTIADTLRVSRSAVDSWFSGTRRPDFETVERLAVVLQTTPEWLTFGVAPTSPGDPEAAPATAPATAPAAERGEP